MRKVVIALSLLCFCAMPMLCWADDYGTPAPLDPSLIHGTQSEAAKPSNSTGNRRNSQVIRSSRGNNNKPQGNKPSSNRSTNQRSSSSRGK